MVERQEGLRMMKFTTGVAVVLVLAFAGYGCGGAGGDPEFSPDPSVGDLFGGNETPGGGDDVIDATGDGDEAQEERDCFLDGFCYRACESAADCPDGFSCIMRVCTFDCQSDAECGAGGVCNSVGLCEASTGEGIPVCTIDADCGDGRFCNADGACEQIPVLLGCQGDVDCPLGQYCDDMHKCELFPGPGVECSIDDDCPGNYYCDALGECTQECRSSYQCGDGEACNDVGRCVAVGAPARLVSFTFGALGADTDPAGPVSFGSASFRLTNVQITTAGRDQILTSPSYRLTGSINY